MGYDTLEDNEMAALDGSRTGGNFSNDITVKTQKVIAGSQKQPVNVSAIIKNIAIKYSKRLDNCEEADETIGKIESELIDTVDLLNQCKLKRPINKKRMLKLKAQLIALKEQLEFVKLEKNRLKCLEEMKNGDEYANVTDVTMPESNSQPNEENKTKAEPIEIKPKKDIDPTMVGVGLLAVAVLGYFFFSGFTLVKNNK
jgi:hypothetical protein